MESVKDSIGVVHLKSGTTKYKMKESVRLDVNDYHSIIT